MFIQLFFSQDGEHYDICSDGPNGEKRFFEVKGRAQSGAIILNGPATRADLGDNILSSDTNLISEVVGVNRRLWEQRIQQWQSFEAWTNTAWREADVSVRLHQIGEMADFWLSCNSDGKRSRGVALTTGRNVRHMHEKLKRIKFDILREW